MILGIVLLSLLLVICTVLYGIFTANNAKQQQQISAYLDKFEERAVTYLSQNETFRAAYGSDCKPKAYSWSYGYMDPSKYPTFAFKPHYPPTAEDFEAELDHLTVSFSLPDGRACTVNFNRNPNGGVEVTGWSYIDEESAP
jgi:hypothetical protein